MVELTVVALSFQLEGIRHFTRTHENILVVIQHICPRRLYTTARFVQSRASRPPARRDLSQAALNQPPNRKA